MVHNKIQFAKEMKKTVFSKDSLLITLRSLFSYFWVGLVAALVEWGSFAFLNYLLRLNYILAVILSFVLATIVNYIFSLGRLWR